MSVNDEWFKSMAQMKEALNAKGVDIQLPPPSMLELGIEYLVVEPGKKMKGKLPFQQRFTNPIRTYQGGFLTAAIDDIFGPLSYASVGGPCTTLSINTTFLKPFTAKMEHCFIEAEVLQKTKGFIFMRATVTSAEGDLLAHAESHCAILNADHLSKVKA